MNGKIAVAAVAIIVVVIVGAFAGLYFTTISSALVGTRADSHVICPTSWRIGSRWLDVRHRIATSAKVVDISLKCIRYST